MAVEAAAFRALELAWKAYGRGTVPVGAVVTSPTGSVLFEGRSRMYEKRAPDGELANSLLAHAEVNALVRLNPAERHENLTITSTLEPCALCLGAIGMATVGRLVYLGPDPYGGAVGLQWPSPHVARVPLAVEGPRLDALGRLAAGLHVAFYLVRSPAGHVVRVHREQAPALLRAGRALVAAGAAELARSEADLAEVLPLLLGTVAMPAGPADNSPHERDSG